MYITRICRCGAMRLWALKTNYAAVLLRSSAKLDYDVRRGRKCNDVDDALYCRNAFRNGSFSQWVSRKSAARLMDKWCGLRSYPSTLNPGLIKWVIARCTESLCIIVWWVFLFIQRMNYRMFNLFNGSSACALWPVALLTTTLIWIFARVYATKD